MTPPQVRWSVTCCSSSSSHIDAGARPSTRRWAERPSTLPRCADVVRICLRGVAGGALSPQPQVRSVARPRTRSMTSWQQRRCACSVSACCSVPMNVDAVLLNAQAQQVASQACEWLDDVRGPSRQPRRRHTRLRDGMSASRPRTAQRMQCRCREEGWESVVSAG